MLAPDNIIETNKMALELIDLTSGASAASISGVKASGVVEYVATSFVPPVGGVESCQPQAPGQLAEVHVCDEPNCGGRQRTYAGHCTDVDVRESREDGDPIAVSNDVLERNRDAIGQDQINLGMWDTVSFNHIFCRRGMVEGAQRRDLSPARRQEIIE